MKTFLELFLKLRPFRSKLRDENAAKRNRILFDKVLGLFDDDDDDDENPFITNDLLFGSDRNSHTDDIASININNNETEKEEEIDSVWLEKELLKVLRQGTNKLAYRNFIYNFSCCFFII